MKRRGCCEMRHRTVQPPEPSRETQRANTLLASLKTYAHYPHGKIGPCILHDHFVFRSYHDERASWLIICLVVDHLSLGTSSGECSEAAN